MSFLLLLPVLVPVAIGLLLLINVYGFAMGMVCSVLTGTYWAALLAGAAIFALVFLLAAPIASVFNHEGSAELHAIAVSGLRLYFAGYLFAGMNIAAAALLSAAAQPERALVLSLLRSCVLLIPASLLLSAALSIRGVWLAFSATEAVVCMLSLRFMRRLR